MQPTTKKQSAAIKAVVEAEYPTQAQIDRAIRRAHRLRARATSSLFRRFGAWLRSSGAALAGRRPTADRPAEASLNALAALRSSAEILRDNPDLDRAQRGRLVDIVLAEEAKLEAIAAKVFGPGRASSGPA